MSESIVEPGEVVFVQPPARKLRKDARYDWPRVAATLREFPGEWGLVASEVSRSLAQTLREGKISAFRPTEHYEVISRNGKGRIADIYARYVGPVNS